MKKERKKERKERVIVGRDGFSFKQSGVSDRKERDLRKLSSRRTVEEKVEKLSKMLR